MCGSFASEREVEVETPFMMSHRSREEASSGTGTEEHQTVSKGRQATSNGELEEARLSAAER
jgi:hypothetical protein